MANQIAGSFAAITRGVPAAISGWIKANVQWVDDDFWALPAQTAQKRAGASNDIAFLAGSLMLARGYSNAKVVMGDVTYGLDRFLRPFGVVARTKQHWWVEYQDWGGKNILDGTTGQIVPQVAWNGYGYTSRKIEVYPDHCAYY